MNVYKSNKIADWGSSEEKTRLSPTATLETNNIVSQRVLFRTLMIIGVLGFKTMFKQNIISGSLDKVFRPRFKQMRVAPRGLK